MTCTRDGIDATPGDCPMTAIDPQAALSRLCDRAYRRFEPGDDPGNERAWWVYRCCSRCQVVPLFATTEAST